MCAHRHRSRTLIFSLLLGLGACDRPWTTLAVMESEAAANDIVVVLRCDQIPVRVERDTGKHASRLIVSVPDDYEDAARRRLSMCRLLPEPPPKAPPDSGLFAAETEAERARIAHEVARLEAALRSFPGVIKASMHVAMRARPLKLVRSSEPRRTTASVAIIYWPSNSDPRPWDGHPLYLRAVDQTDEAGSGGEGTSSVELYPPGATAGQWPIRPEAVARLVAAGIEGVASTDVVMVFHALPIQALDSPPPSTRALEAAVASEWATADLVAASAPSATADGGASRWLWGLFFAPLVLLAVGFVRARRVRAAAVPISRTRRVHD